uniref:Expansin-like EG45 domain-containing protein n=1 Tax=Globisporangium ultimum (strain ATCC 200006 / CBS 805.95 / DAOM BR144) TaxID=431595 RepID=K3WJ67_GLOUD
MFRTATSITTAVAAILLLAAGTPIQVNAAFTGKATTYGTNDSSGGACSVRQTPSGINSSYFVAMNKQQYANACGRCISIKGAKATVTAFVADLCNECGQNNLDLSGNLWTAVTGKTPGIEKITWDFVACPSPKPALCLKEGSNANWVAVQAANVRDGVSQLSIAGQPGTMIGTTAFYFANFAKGLSFTNVPVTVTSVGGVKTTYTATLKVNQCTTA